MSGNIEVMLALELNNNTIVVTADCWSMFSGNRVDTCLGFLNGAENLVAKTQELGKAC
jgi:hypothetical protein